MLTECYAVLSKPLMFFIPEISAAAKYATISTIDKNTEINRIPCVIYNISRIKKLTRGRHRKCTEIARRDELVQITLGLVSFL